MEAAIAGIFDHELHKIGKGSSRGYRHLAFFQIDLEVFGFGIQFRKGRAGVKTNSVCLFVGASRSGTSARASAQQTIRQLEFGLIAIKSPPPNHRAKDNQVSEKNIKNIRVNAISHVVAIGVTIVFDDVFSAFLCNLRRDGEIEARDAEDKD